MDAELVSFPDYTTPMGKLIKAHLKEMWRVSSTGPDSEWNDRDILAHADAMAFQALQFSNRLEHMEKIALVIKSGMHIIADRYTASGIVYGTADGLDTQYLIKTQKFLKQADVNILLDIDVEDSFKRRPVREDRNEVRRDYLEKVAGLYRKLFVEMRAIEGDHKWVVVDGRGTKIETAALIREAVKAVRAR
jgi:thymidylate kinase